MKTKLGHGPHAIVLATALCAIGCGSKSSEVSATPPSPTQIKETPIVKKLAPAAPKERVSDRPANPNGKVFVVEYHHIRAGKNDMIRSPEEFRHDLERLYKDGFRPCTVSQYLDDKMDLPPGASPAVFTFDDANPSQLQLLPDGSVDPKCAVGIWQEFAKAHPDFPVRATFYVLPDTMFGQPKFRQKKVELLRSLGCELGNHTVTHPILKRLPDEKVKQELAVATDDLEKLGEPLPVSIALPFGVSPKNASLTKEFDYKGKHYAFKAAFLVGAEPAPAPTDPKLNRYRIPRIQAYNGICSLDEWLGKFEKGQVKVYVAG